MICRIKEKKTSIMIICAAFLWTAAFPGVSWGLEAPGGGKAVDGTIHNVPVADISKGSDIVNAPRISGTPDSSVLDSSAPNNSSAPVLPLCLQPACRFRKVPVPLFLSAAPARLPLCQRSHFRQLPPGGALPWACLSLPATVSARNVPAALN